MKTIIMLIALASSAFLDAEVDSEIDLKINSWCDSAPCTVEIADPPGHDLYVWTTDGLTYAPWRRSASGSWATLEDPDDYSVLLVVVDDGDTAPTAGPPRPGTSDTIRQLPPLPDIGSKPESQRFF